MFIFWLSSIIYIKTVSELKEKMEILITNYTIEHGDIFSNFGLLILFILLNKANYIQVKYE